MKSQCPRIAQLVGLAVFLTGTLCASQGHAKVYGAVDRLRILNQNIANKTGGFKADFAPCFDDNNCRARMVANRILEGDYDVVAFQEQFDADSMKVLVEVLGSSFPYYVGQLDTRTIAQP